jgi:hypothetical protein
VDIRLQNPGRPLVDAPASRESVAHVMRGELQYVQERGATGMAEEKRPHSTSASAPKRGFIVFDDGYRDVTIDCVIRYVSASGANLEFEKARDVPAQFSFQPATGILASPVS